MSGAVVKLPKPQMRGALISQIKRNIVGVTVFSFVCATTWWYFVSRQRKLNYENFYKNFDRKKEYERMKKAGVFKGIPAADE